MDHVEENGDAVEATHAVDVSVKFEEHQETLGDVQCGEDDQDEFVCYRGECIAEVVKV